MLQNYFKIALRNLWRNKIFSLINISGLALGIATYIFILEYVSYENNYNRFHQNLPNLYRTLFEAEINGKKLTYPYQPPGLAPIAKEQFSQVKNYCRIADGIGVGIVTYKGEAEMLSLRQDDVMYADGSFFEMFSFPILQGNAKELYKPNTVAISQKESLKYFGKQNSIGKILTLHNQFGKHNYSVVAVYQDFPSNSDIQGTMIFSIQTLANPANLNGSTWAELDNLTSNYLVTYFELQKGTNHKDLEAKFNAYKKKVQPKSNELIRLQKMGNLHLAESLSDYYQTYSSLAVVYLLNGVGLLILAIAWFNYVNLSTATSLKRAKEVGIRKVIGANRKQLIFQFLGESFLLNVLGFGLAILLIEVLQGFFNWLIGKPLTLSVLTENWFWLFGLGLLVLGALASGAYTAFALSNFKPTETLKGVFAKSNKGIFLRKALVVFQFSISIALISATLVLYSQLVFMQSKDLGLNLSNVLVIRGAEVGKDSTFSSKKDFFTQQIKQLASVKQYAASGSVPSRWYNFNTGGIKKMNASKEYDDKSYAFVIIDHQFLPTYQIKLVAGKNFKPEDCNKDWGKVEKVILNERAAREMGFESAQKAIHQKLQWGDNGILEVIGVVKDYHHESTQNIIQPMVLYPQSNGSYHTLRLNGKNTRQAIQDLEKLFVKAFPGNPFEYFFVQDSYLKQYQLERQYAGVFINASFLAIFIACLGLFGLATFTVEARTKEIGIRKVMGASTRHIVSLISKDFLKLVLLAFVIASPLAWYGTQQWLQNFAYRIELSVWMFLGSGILAVLVAFLTVAYQAFGASRANPVNSLRCE